VGNAFGARGAAGRLIALLDVGGRPNGVERLVQAKAGIDVPRKFVRLGDDRFERCSNECIAVRLAAR